MKDIIICVGISGSGKSTWTTDFIKENEKVIRCNRDSIRLMLNGTLDNYYKKSNLNEIENFINKIEVEIVESAIHNHYSIVIDNTNLKPSYINKWIALIRDFDYKYNFKFKLFDISLEDATRRVAKRENMQTFEDLGYIDKQYKDYQNIKQWILTNHKEKLI